MTQGVIGFVLGLMTWLFKPHLLEWISQAIGTVWHLATRHKLAEIAAQSKDGRTLYIVDKAWKIGLVRQFLRVSQPPGVK